MYSENWVHQTALEYICRNESRTLHFYPHQRISGFSDKSMPVPGIVVLDISPRNGVAFILKLRKTWPGVYIFFTQQRFLFSDQVVADYFGGIWLKEYDALMAGLPGSGFSHTLISPVFSGVCTPIRRMNDRYREGKIMQELNLFLHHRLSSVISCRGADLVLRWLIRNIPLSEICRLTGLKEKTLYHYRELTMKRLGIKHFARDFIASLTVSNGTFPVFSWLD